MLKEFRTIDKQIEILKNRGLIFDDEGFAKDMKENIYKMMLTKFKENRIVEMDFHLKRCIPKECILSIRKIKCLDGEYIEDEILYKV